MRTTRIMFILLMGCVASAWVLQAAEQPEPTRVEATVDAQTGDIAPNAPATPMVAEILAAVEASQAEVAEFVVRARAAVDEAEAFALAREVHRAKMAGQLEVLRIQLRYAQAEGCYDTAALLQAAIDRMTAPPRTGQPIPRTSGQRPDGR